ncbi:MAG TPA: dihydrofolate reductase family protein [Bacteroidia bacterium]|nr:dihydrofolate reductase family protein [Bacteroidia bacterium]
METKRRVILYIAMSLDGYIAKPNDDLSFLGIVQKEGEDYGYFEFVNSVDTVIVGRKTYDWVMKHVDEFPHKDKTTYIISKNTKPSVNNLHYYNGDLKKLVSQLKSQEGKNIFCDGGAEVVNLLLKDKLIDELIISVIPVLLGEGTRLFKDGRPEQNLKLISSRSYEKGLVQLHYSIH